MPEFLLIPNTAPGMGGGHLARLEALKASLSDRAEILVSKSGSTEALLSKDMASGAQTSLEKGIALFDYRETPAKLLDISAEHRYTIGIDEGGKSRERFHYLVDISMALITPGKANISVSPYPQNMVTRKHAPAFPPRKILLSFGSEDRAGLTRRLLGTLLKTGLARETKITVCEGPRYHESHGQDLPWPDKVTVVRSPASLQDLLLDHDLVFTHFGLTAFEAVSAGTAVILFNPSNYHRLLSCRAGFPEIGVDKPRIKRLKTYFETQGLLSGFLSRVRREMEERKGDSLQAIMSKMEPSGLACCPVCGHLAGKAVERFPDRTYFKCPKCSIYYMLSFFGSRQEYTREYFFGEYSKQYGRTYLEDFQHIKAAGMDRVREILKAANQSVKHASGTEDKNNLLSLLDIGCAYGPFLQAAKEAGMLPEGMDISNDAVAWVKKELGINAFFGDFGSSVPGTVLEGKKYDVITMWYVIEHFKDVRAVLERVNRLLRKGGIFAFSTPSSSGISRRRNLRLFFKASPADHFSIWSKASAKRCLSMAGFKVCRIRVTGHHPERFFGSIRRVNHGDRGKAIKPGTLVFRVLGLVSRIFGLGDTFEAYAIKKWDI